MTNLSALDQLRSLATAIYRSWLDGNKSHSKAMIHQVSQKRLPYVIMTCTLLANHDDKQYSWAEFRKEMAE